MSTNIVYPSALEYWIQEEGIPFRTQEPKVRPSETFSRKEIIDTINSLRFSAPVHVAVPNSINRKQEEGVVFHSIPKNLTQDCFIHVTEAVSVSSPEMTFLQAAWELPLPELVLLACDLCASYVRDPKEPLLQRKREPITSVDSIAAFLDSIRNVKGTKLARQAIRYASDNSNSPMESALATLANLPLYHGGHGLHGFILNYLVKLSKEGRRTLGRDYCICDMVWPDKKVVVEYDSNLTHLAPSQHARDKKRLNALQLSGYTVISVTADQVRNFHSLETLFSVVRRTLRLRPLTERTDKYFEKRWDVTHRIMFGKNRGKTIL